MYRFRQLLAALAFVCLFASATFASVTVSGNLKDLTGTAVTSRTYVRFWIRGCGGNQPRKNGTGVIVPNFYDLTPDASGIISGSLYDSLTEVECGGSVGATWYGVVLYRDGKAQAEVPYNVTGTTFNLNSATPNSTSPVATAPTGDSTYARLDAGNMPFTGAVTAANIYTSNSPNLNVKYYGATGNGSTDDTTAIQSAINVATSTTGCVYFPAGTYKITTVLTGTSTLFCLIGDGVRQSKLTVTNSSSTNAIFTTTSAPDGFKMRGLQFIGPGASASGGQVGVTVGLSGGNVSDAIFEDLYFNGWPNYALELDAPIVTTVRNVRVLQSKRGIYYNGGTSVTTVGCYMNQITLAGYDMRGTDYSSFISNAADTTGIAFLLRNLSQGVTFIGNGHEIGTARNVTVTNVSLTTNVATVTYTGDDLSTDWVSGMTVVIAGTTSTAGLFNGRYEPTSVTSSTIIYALTHANVASAADTGTGSLFPGDGIVINNSSGTQVSGFYGLSAQQLTSDHVVVSGTSNNTNLFGIISELGSSGTPVTQTVDVYMGANAQNVMRFNNNLIGGTSNSSTNSQTYSNGSWTIGAAVSQNGTPATSGFIRMIKTGTVQFRDNGNTANISGLAKDTSDIVQVGDAAGVKFVGPIFPSTAGGQTVGTNALPFSSAYIGAAATNNSQITGTFTAARVHTLPDVTGNVEVRLSGSDATVDLASVASAACTTERTVAITGAAFGDQVNVTAGTALEAGTSLKGNVSSAGNIKWAFCNLSGGAVDRASDTYTIKVIK